MQLFKIYLPQTAISEGASAKFGFSIIPFISIKLMLNDEKVSACMYEGEKFDCGSKQGFVEATIAISLRDEEIKDDITKYIKQLST